MCEKSSAKRRKHATSLRCSELLTSRGQDVLDHTRTLCLSCRFDNDSYRLFRESLFPFVLQPVLFTKRVLVSFVRRNRRDKTRRDNTAPGHFLSISLSFSLFLSLSRSHSLLVIDTATAHAFFEAQAQPTDKQTDRQTARRTGKPTL